MVKLEQKIAKATAKLQELINTGYTTGHSLDVLKGFGQAGYNFKMSMLIIDLLISQDIQGAEFKRIIKIVNEHEPQKDVTEMIERWK